MEGTEKNDICNRNGCKGIIAEQDHDGCSCHDNPPCSSCVTAWEYCPECDWSAREEADDIYNKMPKQTHVVQEYKRKTLVDLDKSKIDYFISNVWHSGTELTGVYPEGSTMDDVVKYLKSKSISFHKEAMPKFKYFGGGIFKFSYFTD